MYKNFIKLFSYLIFITLLLCLFGCSATEKNMDDNQNVERKYLQIKELSKMEIYSFNKKDHHYLEIDNSSPSSADGKKVVVADDGSFFDDFNNGIDPDLWEIPQKAWGGGNHGVLRSNVSYTNDGIVVLTGNGDLYDGPLNQNLTGEKLGERSGACLVTKKQLGPGSYEVKMKVCPQMGACTAMWTFFWTNTSNHEIDIEIPASTKNFKQSQFVTYRTEENPVTKKIYPDYFHNDGEWHTYRFDWHTEDPHVDFYVDNVLQTTITSEIPDTAGNLWLGVWFPKRWSGVPLFDTSYLLVDYFKYTAFDEPYNYIHKTFNKTPSKAYPKEPIDLPTCNFISNAGFEYDTNTWTIENNAYAVINPQRNDYMLELEDNNSNVKQIANSIVPDSKYLINFSSYGKGKVIIEYLDNLYSDDIINKEEIDFDNNGFTQYSKELFIPKDCYRIQITLKNEGKNSVYYDDIYIVQPNRDDFNVII